MLRSPSPNTSKPGFTLVELLVSTAILSMLLLLLAQAATMLGNTWTSGNGRAERRQNGRALVDFIGQELRAAALPIDKSAPLTSADLQFLVNPASISSEFKQPDCLFWQAPLATDTTKGDMAVIGYFVKWDDSINRANLCRVFINPGNANHLIYDEADNWINDAILNTSAPADYDSGYLGLFAENVIGFWVRCLDKSGAPIIQSGALADYDSRITYIGDAYDETGAPIKVTYPAPVLPDSVEISLVLLDNRSASQLTGSHVAAIKSAAQAEAPLPEGVSPANQFMRDIQTNPSMRRIIQGMSAHSVRVYLENAP